jgi:hypothetical protein
LPHTMDVGLTVGGAYVGAATVGGGGVGALVGAVVGAVGGDDAVGCDVTTSPSKSIMRFI